MKRQSRTNSAVRYKIKEFRNDLDSLLTPEESQERIILLLIALTLILSFFLALLYIWLLSIVSNIKEILYLDPNLSQLRTVGFPIPHFGILTRSGSFLTFISPLLYPRNEKFISLKKIPKFKGLKGSWIYGATYDQTNVLSFSHQNAIFFLYTVPERQMIKFDTLQNRSLPQHFPVKYVLVSISCFFSKMAILWHESCNGEVSYRHRTLPKSGIPEHQANSARGIMVGKFFFIMGGAKKPSKKYTKILKIHMQLKCIYYKSFLAVHLGTEGNYNQRTNFWSTTKESWFNGPIVPNDNEIFDLNLIGAVTNIPDLNSICLVAVNSSIVYIMGTDSLHFLVSINFVTKSWKRHEPSRNGYTRVKDCVHFITKQHKSMILTIETDDLSTPSTQISDFPKYLMIYDIDQNFWQKQELDFGRGLLAISGSVFIIDYQIGFDGNVTEIDFIPFDLKQKFLWDKKVTRNVNFGVKDHLEISHLMFVKPVSFLLRNYMK